MATTGYHDIMIIVCPACAAAYDLADGHLTSGQAVRCARCSREWLPVAEAEPDRVTVPQAGPPLDRPLDVDPMPPIPPPPIATVLKLLAPSFVGTANASAALAAWGLSVVVLVSLGWAAVTWRTDVMRAWPPSTRLYAAIGLPGR